MNQANKKFLSDNYNLKEQAEAGSLVLAEEQKREFYKVLHEEVDANAIVNLYGKEALNDMVKQVFYHYDYQYAVCDVDAVKPIEPKTKVVDNKKKGK